MDEALIVEATRDIVKASRVVALTGAGHSVESGIAPFRGKGGLWEKYDPEEYGHIRTVRNNPEKAWIMLAEMQREIVKANPNPGHDALAELERMGHLRCIITQNVDGLHQEAGSQEVIEFHGNMRWVTCMSCGKRKKSTEISLETLPPRCECEGAYKPDAVFFGEMIPPDALSRAHKESSSCQVMLVIATSGTVYPAASMPDIAKSSGAKVIEINRDRSALTASVTDLFIQGTTATVLPRIVEKIKTDA
jgi:NAD-dependent deacetylase